MDHTCISLPTEAPAVDVMSLLGRCLGSIPLTTRVLSKFCETGYSDLEQLGIASEEEDFTNAAEIAHRFKGSASNVSAPGLHALAARAEQLGREQDSTGLNETLDQLREEWDRFLQYARAFTPEACASTCQAGPSN